MYIYWPARGGRYIYVGQLGMGGVYILAGSVLARSLNKTVIPVPPSRISRHRIHGRLCYTLLLLSSSFIPTPPFNSIIIPTMQNHIRVNTRRSPLKAVPKHDNFCAEEENSKFKMAPPFYTSPVTDPLHYPLHYTPPLGCFKDTTLLPMGCDG